VSAVLNREAWVSTLREVLLKSLLGLWIAAFVVSVLSDSIPAHYPLGMASAALLAFAFFPTKSNSKNTSASDASDSLGNEVV